MIQNSELGSMFVWIPQYAYRIVNGYHNNTAGTIDIKFTDIYTNYLGDISQKLLTDGTTVTYTADSQNEYLLHPAFNNGTAEVKGIWFAKFQSSSANGATRNIRK